MASLIETVRLPGETVADALAFIAEGLAAAAACPDREALAVTMAKALAETLAASEIAWLILDRTGLPVGALGASPTPAGANVWAAATVAARPEIASIARLGRGAVADLAGRFGTVAVLVDPLSALARRWLEWSGFATTGAPIRREPEERLFVEYTRTPD